mmetsp:Transcript_92533/g.261386  ORF Transcript_92533/g.261386 Transcript_92533/m.261386 type:complete len:261 (+) Transcript_92533:457-1239(+)
MACNTSGLSGSSALSPRRRRHHNASLENKYLSTICRKLFRALWLDDSVNKSNVRERILNNCSAERCLRSDCAAQTSPSMVLLSSTCSLSNRVRNDAPNILGTEWVGNSVTCTSRFTVRSSFIRKMPTFSTRCSDTFAKHSRGRSGGGESSSVDWPNERRPFMRATLPPNCGVLPAFATDGQTSNTFLRDLTVSDAQLSGVGGAVTPLSSMGVRHASPYACIRALIEFEAPGESFPAGNGEASSAASCGSFGSNGAESKRS